MERHIRHCHPLKDGLVEGAVIAFAMDFECHLVEVVLQLAELVFPPLRHIPAAVLEAAPKPQEVCTLQWRLSADAFPTLLTTLLSLMRATGPGARASNLILYRKRPKNAQAAASGPPPSL